MFQCTTASQFPTHKQLNEKRTKLNIAKVFFLSFNRTLAQLHFSQSLFPFFWRVIFKCSRLYGTCIFTIKVTLKNHTKFVHNQWLIAHATLCSTIKTNIFYDSFILLLTPLPLTSTTLSLIPIIIICSFSFDVFSLQFYRGFFFIFAHCTLWEMHDSYQNWICIKYWREKGELKVVHKHPSREIWRIVWNRARELVRWFAAR